MAKRITKTVKNSFGNRVSLQKGECLRSDGMLVYRYTDSSGSRKTISASNIELLREKEKQLNIDSIKGISSTARSKSLDDVFKEWSELKRGVREHTMVNYKWLYNQYVFGGFGKRKIQSIKNADIRRFYNSLYDVRNLALKTVDGVHVVVGQIFSFALDNKYIDSNPCIGAISDLKRAHNDGKQKHIALTIHEQNRFLNYLKSSDTYSHWYPVFAVMLGTGMRVGEIIGLRWCDIDIYDKCEVDVNHTLIYYKNDDTGKMVLKINPPKSISGVRTISMIENVKEAFIQQREYLTKNNIECNISVDGYTDFIFLNRFGRNHNQYTLNKAIRTIVRDANYDALERNDGTVLLPKFSCHNLRSSFCTRLAEADVNLKVAMKLMGHGDSRTTMAVYTTVHKDWEIRELSNLEDMLKSST